MQFARAGYQTRMYNRSEEGRSRALEAMRLALDVLVEHGLESEDSAGSALERVSPSFELAQVATGAGFVVEAVSEDMRLKRSLFAELDRLCPPPAILATDTSGLSITEIASATASPGRVIGTHHFNPPYLVPGVEVVSGLQTTEETVRRTCSLLRSIGKLPVLVKDVVGFVANRLSVALKREAWAIVEQGLARPEEVDAIWTSTLGPIYAALGPLQVSDASGLDVLVTVHEYVEPVLTPASDASEMVRGMREREEFGIKSGRGFYRWTPESAAALIKRRDELLLRMLGVSRPTSGERP